MKLSALLNPLLNAKVDHELIRQQILAYEQQQEDALEHRRKVDAERQNRKRERDKSRDITLRHSDSSLTRDHATRAHSEKPNSVIEEKKESKVRACRLPTDFAPDVSWAVSQGMSHSQANSEAAKFRDYWSAKGANATKTDWPATWRNWVRSSLERQPVARGSPPDKPRSVLDAVNALNAKLEQANANSAETIQGTGAVVLRLPAAQQSRP